MNLKRKILIPLLGALVLVLALAFASACAGTKVVPNPDDGSQTEQDGDGSQTPSKNVYDMSAVEFSDVTVTYDGEPHSIQISGTLPAGVSVFYEGNGKTDAGTYTVTAHFTGDSKNYQSIPDKTATLTIEQATVEGITFEGETVVYNGEAHSIFIKGDLPEGVSVSYEGNGMTNVGQYTVTAKFQTDKNHKPIADMVATLTINKATFDMTKVKFEDDTVVYDGNAHSITVSNLPTGVQATYDGNGKVNAGTYTITVHFTVDTTNYNTIADRTAKLTIEKATYDMKDITFNGLTVVYDGNTHPLAIQGQLPTGVDVSYENNDQTTAGEHKVIAHFTGDTQNHNLIPDKGATLVIEKATYDMKDITFEGETHTYDGKTHPLAVQGQLPKNVSVSYENNDQTTAGQHEVIAHFTGDKANYNEIEDMKATLTVEQATVEGITFEGKTITYNGETQSLKITGDLPEEVSVRYENNDQVDAGEYDVKAIFDTGNNYKPLAEMTAKLIIEQATVEGITFEGLKITYDGNAHPLKITGDLPEEVSVRYENNDQVNAGEYQVKAIFDTGKNYKPLSDMVATLTIEKATYDMKNITFEGKTITYDGNTHPLAIQGQLPKDVDVSYENNDQTTAGQHEVIAHFTGDKANYHEIDDMRATLIIEKADYDMRGITFDGETLTYDGSEHSLKIKGDLPEGVDVSYEGNSGKNVGVYPVKAHFTGDTQNHNLIPDKSATLTIEKRELTVRIKGETQIKYDRQAHKDYSVEATNLLAGDSVKFILTYSGDMIEKGEYTVKATIEEHQNYKLTKDNTLTVVITRAMHKVIFKQEDQADQVVEVLDLAGVSQEQIPTPAAVNGYTVKWQDIDLSCITADVTVNAVKTPITYTIRYYLDEGQNNSYNPESYDITTPTVTLAAPTKNGYTFLGWFKGSLSGDQIKEIAQGSTGNLNLYAKWVLTEYEITYNNLYNGKNHSDNPKTYNIKTEYIFGDASRDGYTFAGWYKDPGFDEKITEITLGSQGPLVIYAEWDIITYDINYNMNEGTNNQANPQTYDVETDTITLATPTRDYYTFAGWYKDARFNTRIEEIPLGSFGEIDLYAKWTPIDYTITYNTDGGDNNSQNPRTYNVETPTFELKDATKDGYTFLGWFTSRSGAEKVERIDLGSHGSRSLYARWTPTVYEITYYLNEGQNSEKNPQNYTIETKTIYLEDPTRDYYDFAGWYKDAKFGEQIEEIPLGSFGKLDLYAKWTPTEYEIRYHLDEDMKNGANPATYNVESAFTFQKPTRLHYTFLGWFKDDGYTEEIKNIKVGEHGELDLYAKWAYGTEGLKYTLSEGKQTVSGYTGKDTDVVIPDTWETAPVTHIATNAFQNKRITSITIPESMTDIDSSAFSNCTSLTTVYWNATNCTKAESYGYLIFVDCTALTTVYTGESVERIPAYAFSRCTSLASITISESVTSIGQDAFEDCKNLASVDFAGNSSLTSIGSGAFYNCTSLESITIPESVTTIGAGAFFGCTSLTSVNFGDNSSLTSIDIAAFEQCEGLENITIPDSVTSIGNNAFSRCTSLASITIPASVTSIGNYAFQNCTSLESITIPENVTSIGKSTFYLCTGLESITILESVTSIGEFAFGYCTSLERVYYGGTTTQWSCISIGTYNDDLTKAARYYYSEGTPSAEQWAESNYWWHRDPDTGEVLIWKKES